MRIGPHSVPMLSDMEATPCQIQIVQNNSKFKENLYIYMAMLPNCMDAKTHMQQYTLVLVGNQLPSIRQLCDHLMGEMSGGAKRKFRLVDPKALDFRD